MYFGSNSIMWILLLSFRWVCRDGCSVVVADQVVRGVGVVGQGFGVDGGRGEASYAVDQVVLDLVAQVVRLDQGGGGVHGDARLGKQLVAVPAQPDVGHVDHAGGGADDLLGLVDQGRVDGVHQPPVDLAGGIAQNEQDRHGDQQT